MAMDQDEVRREVSLALDRLNRAWVEGHPEELVSLFDEDIVMSFPAGGVRFAGRTVLVASFEEFVRTSKILDFRETDREIDVLGEIAVTSFGYELLYEREGQRTLATGRDLWIFRAAADGSFRAIFRTMFDLEETPAPPTF